MSWKKHKNIIIFLLVTVVGIGIFIYNPDGLGWRSVVIIGSATTIALAVLAFMAYFDYAKGEDNIKIYFSTTDVPKIYTRLYTQRKHFTRSEVQGLLGMIYIRTKEKPHYDLKSFNKDPKILKEFKKIQDGRSDELIIEASKEELSQFNVLN